MMFRNDDRNSLWHPHLLDRWRWSERFAVDGGWTKQSFARRHGFFGGDDGGGRFSGFLRQGLDNFEGKREHVLIHLSVFSSLPRNRQKPVAKAVKARLFKVLLHWIKTSHQQHTDILQSQSRSGDIFTGCLHRIDPFIYHLNSMRWSHLITYYNVKSQGLRSICEAYLNKTHIYSCFKLSNVLNT